MKIEIPSKIPELLIKVVELLTLIIDYLFAWIMPKERYIMVHRRKEINLKDILSFDESKTREALISAEQSRLTRLTKSTPEPPEPGANLFY